MAEEKPSIEVEYIYPSAGLVQVERFMDEVVLYFANLREPTLGAQVVMRRESAEAMLELFEDIAHRLREQLRPASTAH